MIPPRGFKAELYPLRHRLIHSFQLSLEGETQNTALIPLVMGSSEMDVAASAIPVNPHNAGYLTDAGPLCRQMSIIDRLSLSLKFTMTKHCESAHHAAGTSTNETFVGDNVNAFSFLWRPIFFSFGEKLDAADDVTTTTVAAILGLTKDATNEDVVPLTTNKLPIIGPAELSQPLSTVNAVQVKEDYNYSTNMTMEDHVFDEDLLRTALKRYTNKGALKACIGRARYVTLTRTRPYKNFYIQKFVPRAIRRIVPYTFMGIQIHLPLESDIEQQFVTGGATSGVGHLGIKMITHYHEWNADHDQTEGSS